MRRLLIGAGLVLLLILTAGPVGLLLSIGIAIGWLARSHDAVRPGRLVVAGWLLYVAVSLVLSIVTLDVLLMLITMSRVSRV